MSRNHRKRNFLSVLFSTLTVFLLLNQVSYGIDPGKKDTLLVYPQDCNFMVVGFHDEPLSGFAVPFKYKNPQTDINLDSVKFHRVMQEADMKDTVIDRQQGTVVVYAIWFDSTPPATDTLFTLYFTPGPSWDPAILNKLDTFRMESSQGLSFTDVDVNDIMPHIGSAFDFGNECVEFWQAGPKGDSKIPSKFFLSNNLPNPFNSETVISFGLSQPTLVTIEIFNILGQKVKTLSNGQMPVGYHRASWDGKDSKGKKVQNGISFYRMTAGDFRDVKKMSFIK